MKFSGFEEIDPGVRAFILIVVAVAYPAWDAGFELGVFGRLFYEKVFVAWSISTALFVVLLVFPKDKLRVPTIAWFATLIPSLWLVIALVIRAEPDVRLLGYALTATGFVATGYVIGENHSHLLTCEDFEISGHYVPADCRPLQR